MEVGYAASYGIPAPTCRTATTHDDAPSAHAKNAPHADAANADAAAAANADAAAATTTAAAAATTTTGFWKRAED